MSGVKSLHAVMEGNSATVLDILFAQGPTCFLYQPATSDSSALRAAFSSFKAKLDEQGALPALSCPGKHGLKKYTGATSRLPPWGNVRSARLIFPICPLAPVPPPISTQRRGRCTATVASRRLRHRARPTAADVATTTSARTAWP